MSAYYKSKPWYRIDNHLGHNVWNVFPVSPTEIHLYRGVAVVGQFGWHPALTKEHVWKLCNQTPYRIFRVKRYLLGVPNARMLYHRRPVLPRRNTTYQGHSFGNSFLLELEDGDLQYVWIARNIIQFTAQAPIIRLRSETYVVPYCICMDAAGYMYDLVSEVVYSPAQTAQRKSRHHRLQPRFGSVHPYHQRANEVGLTRGDDINWFYEHMVLAVISTTNEPSIFQYEDTCFRVHVNGGSDYADYCAAKRKTLGTPLKYHLLMTPDILVPYLQAGVNKGMIDSIVSHA